MHVLWQCVYVSKCLWECECVCVCVCIWLCASLHVCTHVCKWLNRKFTTVSTSIEIIRFQFSEINHRCSRALNVGFSGICRWVCLWGRCLSFCVLKSHMYIVRNIRIINIYLTMYQYVTWYIYNNAEKCNFAHVHSCTDLIFFLHWMHMCKIAFFGLNI